MSLEWSDLTRSDPRRTSPVEFPVQITVTRHLCAPGRWYLVAPALGIEYPPYDLGRVSLPAAKQKALRKVAQVALERRDWYDAIVEFLEEAG